VRVFTSFDEVAAAAGEDLGSTDWVTIDQERVDRFAEATGDHQWIHVDVDRAADGPFGGTIAHGYLTLSLVPWLGGQIFSLDTPGAKLNYGVNKVRFPSPLRVGKRVRGHASFGEITDLPAGKQAIIRYTVEIEDEPKPACVAETVVLLLED
jgi:acyl dehydratase